MALALELTGVAPLLDMNRFTTDLHRSREHNTATQGCHGLKAAAVVSDTGSASGVAGWVRRGVDANWGVAKWDLGGVGVLE
jgi:hypothetical protein